MTRALTYTVSTIPQGLLGKVYLNNGTALIDTVRRGHETLMGALQSETREKLFRWAEEGAIDGGTALLIGPYPRAGQGQFLLDPADYAYIRQMDFENGHLGVCTQAEAARVLNCARQGVASKIKNGKLEFIPVGDVPHIPVDVLPNFGLDPHDPANAGKRIPVAIFVERKKKRRVG